MRILPKSISARCRPLTAAGVLTVPAGLLFSVYLLSKKPDSVAPHHHALEPPVFGNSVSPFPLPDKWVWNVNESQSANVQVKKLRNEVTGEVVAAGLDPWPAILIKCTLEVPSAPRPPHLVPVKTEPELLRVNLVKTGRPIVMPEAGETVRVKYSSTVWATSPLQVDGEIVSIGTP